MEDYSCKPPPVRRTVDGNLKLKLCSLGYMGEGRSLLLPWRLLLFLSLSSPDDDVDDEIG